MAMDQSTATDQAAAVPEELFERAKGVLAGGVSLHPYTRQGPPGHAGFSLAHADEDFAEALTVFDSVAKAIAAGNV